MKILPEISNLTAKFINVSEGNFTLLTINENINILFKNGNQLNKDILLDLIESKGYATSLLYLNETSQVYLNEQTDLINESNINDYYSDCEELLTKNIIIVEEAGIPLVNINGYKIYESDIGVLRGNGKKKIKESFDNKELDNDLKEAIKQHIIDAYSEEGKHYGFDSRAPYLTDGYAVAIYQRVKGGLPSYNIISNMKKYYEDIKDTVVKENNLKESINTEDLAYDLLDLAKIIDLYDFKDNYDSDEEALEEFKRDLNSKSQIKDYITFIRNYIEDKATTYYEIGSVSISPNTRKLLSVKDGTIYKYLVPGSLAGKLRFTYYAKELGVNTRGMYVSGTIKSGRGYQFFAPSRKKGQASSFDNKNGSWWKYCKMLGITAIPRLCCIQESGGNYALAVIYKSDDNYIINEAGVAKFTLTEGNTADAGFKMLRI